MRKLNSFCMTLGLLFSLLLFALASPGIATATEQQTVVLSMEQYTTLNSLLQEQEATLVLLKSRYQMLKLPSKELVEQLDKAENELQNCRQDLASAKVSLTNAWNKIEQLKASLEKLEKAIEQERKKARLTKLQRNVWCCIAVVASGVAIKKTIKTE